MYWFFVKETGGLLMSEVFKQKVVKPMKCKNCDYFQSYQSAYEDEEEPDDSGFCLKFSELYHVDSEDECLFGE